MKTSSNPKPVTNSRVIAQPMAKHQGKVGKEKPKGTLSLVSGLGLAIILISLLCCSSVFIGFIYYSFQVSDRIQPGIHFAGKDLGGKTIPEAASIIIDAWDNDQQIIVEDGFSVESVSANSLGIYVDGISTATKAYQIGRTGDIFQRVSQILSSRLVGLEIKPDYALDQNRSLAALNDLSIRLQKVPKEAEIKISGDEIVGIPGEIGYVINQNETMDYLSGNLANVVETRRFKVKLQPWIPQVMDLSSIIPDAQNFINNPVRLTFYDPMMNESFDLQIPKESLAGWVTAKIENGDPKLALDPAQITQYLSENVQVLWAGRFIEPETFPPSIAEQILNGQIPRIPVKHSATTYQVQPGDTLLRVSWKVGIPFWRIAAANPGMDADALQIGQELTIPSIDDLAPLPIIPGKRIVISISKQRLWAYENGEVISKQIISTGIDRSPTQPGFFQVQTHVKEAYASVWDLYMPNFLGIYEAWPGFMNGIHGLPTLSNGRRLWANILGRPASYGCIIMELDSAEWLYNWAEDGVIVEIQP